jgi:hypothetical protein
MARTTYKDGLQVGGAHEQATAPHRLTRHGGRTRRAFFAQGALLGAATLAGEVLAGSALASVAEAAAQGNYAPPTPPMRDADYWAFADWMQGGMDRLWNEQQGWYTDDARINALALTTHSVAALSGHNGAARNDDRARRVAARLCQEPPYKSLQRGQSPGGGSPRSAFQNHRPGFVAKLAHPHSKQHIAIDPKIARGLYYAWRARRELALPPQLVDLIAHRVNTVAHSRFFRYPNVRLNQINFAAELFACAASITGETTLARKDYRRQLVRFLRGARRPSAPWKTTNLSPSYSFHRNPFQRTDGPQNIESNEYANIVLDVISYYEQASRAGMAPLGRSELRTLRAWVKRALPAYWTHSGYLNWDTGLYLKRWHLTRYWAWACQGLLAIATSHRFASDDERAWAKYMLDRAFALYARLCRDRAPDSRAPGSTTFGIKTNFSEAPHFEMARFQALAAEAMVRGLGAAEAKEPPSLYAFDPAIGRLAITTPTYNTAIVAVSNRAFPYGGIEPARLFDSDQRVLAHIGGAMPAGIGVVVRNGAGHTVAVSQRPGRRSQPDRLPIVLTKSPRGRVARANRYPARPYAGPFELIEVAGRHRESGISFHTRHRFQANHIELNWRLRRRSPTKLSAEVMLPTWGRGLVQAVMRDGSVYPLERGGSVRLTDVLHFWLTGSDGGYVVVASNYLPQATARAAHPPRQRSNPNTGPSLAVQLVPASAWKRLGCTVRLAPASDTDTARALARDLGAH